MSHRYQTQAVAAAAMPRNVQKGNLTHCVDLETGLSLCKRVKPASLLDDVCATDPNAAPTCEVCARRDPRKEF
jgi:hypothetical protein